jgi:hypothetical protein
MTSSLTADVENKRDFRFISDVLRNVLHNTGKIFPDFVALIGLLEG